MGKVRSVIGLSAILVASAHAAVRGKTYFFDNEEHLREFVLAPDKYLRTAPAEGARRDR
ncbi:MAG: hypothetical protein HY554_00515 [Elusimicrobia bacterium]|nr:hypothetical protein [Elusimicrobiota bacterium]